MTGTVASDVDMANLALSKLTEPAIVAFDESSKASRWFKRNYAPARDIFLAKHYWNCALRNVALAPDSIGPDFRFTYQYTMPAGCLRILPITEDGERNGDDLIHEVFGNKIQTNHGPVLYLSYVSRISEGLFDPLLVDAFAYYLAAGVCHSITGKNSLVQTMQVATDSALNEAGMADAMQGTPYPPVKSDYLLIRDQPWA